MPAILLPTLHADPACRACPLGAQAGRCCIPTTRLPGPDDTALIVLGNQPGVDEEQSGEHFSGSSGRIARGVYLAYKQIASRCTVYLSNAVRCRPPGESNATAPQVRACAAQWLAPECDAIRAAHPRTVLLACGASATRAVFGCSLTDAFHRQGALWRNIPVFVTYNPAQLQRNRDPALVEAVQSHLDLLDRWLRGIPLAAPTPIAVSVPRALAVPAVPVLALDIETYGAVLSQPEQTCFHPAKSLAHDRVDPADLIQTVALAWPVPDAPAPAHSVYVWPDDKPALSAILRAHIHRGGTLLAMNTVFDLTYLRTDPDMARILAWPRFRRHGALLDDLAIVNHQHSNVRPERSLKSLALLRGTADYSHEQSLRRGERYQSRYDPALWRYNCLDAVTTLQLWTELADELPRLYPGTTKRTPYTRLFWSRLLWTVIHMTEAGIHYDRAALSRLETDALAKCDAIRSACARLGLIIAGPGSQAPVQALFNRMVAAAGVGLDPRLERTDKTREISTDRENIQLLESTLPRSSPDYRFLRALSRYRWYNAKICGTYCGPMLRGTGRSGPPGALLGPVAYPQWYPVPMHAGRDSDSGGTQQARFAAKLPPVQTEPADIYDLRVSRWPGSQPVVFDYKNLEMYVCALLSGDPVMMSECAAGIDFHRAAALLCFGPSIAGSARYAVCRQACKVFNFGGLIYRGGARTVSERVRFRTRLELPVSDVARHLSSLRRKYRRIDDWQLRELIPDVRRTGIVRAPLLDDTRLLIRGAMAEEAYTNVICNFAVQVIAARIVQDAHAALIERCTDAGLATVFPCQTHDSIMADPPVHERPLIRRWMADMLPRPDFYRRLCAHLGRSVPLAVEEKT